MAQNTATVEVEHNNETIAVPTTFEQSDYAAYFGDVPESFDVERIFELEGALRVEAYLGNDTWVEAVLHTDDWHETFNAKNDRGWVVETVNAPEDGETPGDTLWEAE